MAKKQDSLKHMIKDLASGQRLAFEAWFDLLASKIKAVAYAVLLEEQSSEDVVQDTFLELFKMADRLIKLENPGAYAMKSARNRALNLLRAKSGEMKKLKGRFGLTESADAGSSVLSVEELEELQAKLQAMPTEEREAIVLHLFEKMSFEQMAELWEVTLHQARYRYDKAIQSLKESYA